MVRLRRSRAARPRVALAALVAAGLVAGSHPSPSASSGPSDQVSYRAHGYEWKPVRIGGGGNVTGIAAADDGTLVSRVDVYGAYVLSPGASMWRQLITTSAMPEAWHLPKLGKGIEEVAIAPSDSGRIYVMFAGHLFVTDDQGLTFAETSFAPTNWDSNGDFGRGFGDRMAVDPIDPDHVIAGGPNTPLRRSTDGGATWADSTVPAGARHTRIADNSGNQILSVGITGVAFARGSGTAGGHTKTAFAASWGRGVYRTNDGGATWSPIGGPTTVEHASIDGSGRYYAIHGDANGPWGISMYDGTWHDITPVGYNPEAIASVENPFLAAAPERPGTVVAGYAKQLYRTTDGGTTWTALHWSDGSGDITWADADIDNYYLVASDLVFDPLHSGRMWLSTGSGVQYSDLPNSNPNIVWHEKTKGIESMVATDVVSTRSGPIFGVFDFGQFGGSKNLDGFALKKGPVPFFSGTTALDASPFSSNFAVSVTTDYVRYGQFPISSSYTTNGGRTWTRFPTMPKNATSASQFGYGTIAVSTPDNIVWAPGRYYPTETDDFQPYYTTDKGRSWKPVVLPGVSSYPADSIGGFMFGRNRQSVTADQVRRGTFYLYMADQGVFRTTDKGKTWTRMHAGNFSPGQPGFSGLMQAMPGSVGNLFWTDGSVGGHDWQGPQQYAGYPFYRSRDGGATWSEVPRVGKVMTFGFGAAKRGSRYATIYVVGEVDQQFGIWSSTDDGQTWTLIGDFPYTVDWLTTIAGDMTTYGTVYIGFAGSSFVYGTPIPS